MTLHDLVSRTIFGSGVEVKKDYKVLGFEQFGYIETIVKQRKDKVDVYFKNGHQLPNMPRQQVVIQE